MRFKSEDVAVNKQLNIDSVITKIACSFGCAGIEDGVFQQIFWGVERYFYSYFCKNVVAKQK